MSKKAFFDRISHDWDEEHSAPEEEQRTRAFTRHFDLKPGERVLDVGCGTGRLIPFLKEYIGQEGILVAVDFSKEMLDIGREKHRFKRLYFFQGDAHRLALKDHSFTTVICMALFPHLGDKAGALKEFRRLLIPGGTLFITHQMSRQELNRFHQEVKGPVTRDLLPDEVEMRGLFASAGYKNLSIRDEPSLYIARARVRG
jgi:ubiquinone/menaquinone biosynthesis C-methylase UbiE